jgi:hypothetical protein
MANFLKVMSNSFVAKREELKQNLPVPIDRRGPWQRNQPQEQPGYPEIIEPARDLEQPIPAQLFRFEMWCSIHGKPFVAVAQRHHNALWLVGNERVTYRANGYGRPSELFVIAALPSWRCYWCGAREGQIEFLDLFWVCNGHHCGTPYHCAGSQNGAVRCACGQYGLRKFVRIDQYWVRPYDGLRGPDGRGYCTGPDASTGSLIQPRLFGRR